MGAVRMRFAAELRGRWRSWLALALLIGLAAGFVIAAAAGARRTDTAYERFLRDQHAYDVLVFNDYCPGPEDLEPGEKPYDCDVTKVADFPQVRVAAQIRGMSGDLRTSRGRSLQPGGSSDYTGPGEVIVAGSPDGSFGRAVNRSRVLEGRLPRDEAPNEVALSQELARRGDVQVGDTLRAHFRTIDQAKVRHDLEVVGIEVAPGELVPPSGNYNAVAHVSRALVELAEAEGWETQTGLALRLVDGDRSIPALRREIEDRRIRAFVGFAQSDSAEAIERTIRPQVVALVLLATFAGLAVIAVFGTALARQAWTESEGYDVLWALGVRRRELVVLTLLRAAAVGVLAAPLAVLSAIALSPLAPIGAARAAEPQPGLSVDGLALGVGGVLVVLSVVALVTWPALRIARANAAGGIGTDPGRRPSNVATAMAAAGFAPAPLLGVRAALERGAGRTSVPTRTGFLGVTAALVALCAALAFGTSLRHLIETPRLVGFNWDAVVGIPPGDRDDIEGLTAQIGRAPGIVGATAGTFFFERAFPDTPLLLGPGRLPVDLLAIGPGVVGPSVIDGRAPVAADEILLASETSAELGLEPGGTVVAFGQVGDSGLADAYQPTKARFRIVGIGVIPGVGGDQETEARIGRGAVLTIPGLQRLNPVATPSVVYVRFDPSTDREQALASLRATVRARPRPQRIFVGTDESAIDTEGTIEVSSIEALPLLLGVLTGIVGIGVLAHLLVSSARARRRDLAVLRAIGFRRRQVGRTVRWHSLTVVAVGLGIGVPVGLALGRVAWNVYARSIGVVPEPSIVGLTVLAVVVGALLVACLVAIGPGRAATHPSPAAVLRAE